MKKITFALFIMVTIMVTKAGAQDVQLVTLQHGDNSSLFYGNNGFVNAMNAAVDGDLITLSSGTFTSATVNKVVTIQGSGYINDIANSRYRTYFPGEFTVDMPNGKEGPVIEGIYFEKFSVKDTIKSLSMKKCNVGEFTLEHGHSVNCNINQCRIRGSFTPDGNSENLCISNSIVAWLQDNNDEASLTCLNDYIRGVYVVTANFKNCILYGLGSRRSGCCLYNNVFFDGSLDGLIAQSGNSKIAPSDILANSSETEYSDNYYYKLTAAAASKYLGTDGTQVGIYGGDTSFSDVPSNPQITKREISEKSTTDGKLKVNITVEAQK